MKDVQTHSLGVAPETPMSNITTSPPVSHYAPMDQTHEQVSPQTISFAAEYDCELRCSSMPIVFPESLKDLTLWRYMGLEKLLSLLQSRSLYFAQLKSFRDPYEGMVPIAWQGAITDVSQIPDFSASNGSPEWQQIMLSIPDGQHLKDEKLRTELYVSCWHSNPHESAAMWSLYSKT